MSPHEPGVREALLNAEFMGVAPPVVRLVGVVPGERRDRHRRSRAEVRAAVPAAVAQVARELAALGVERAAREPPARRRTSGGRRRAPDRVRRRRRDDSGSSDRPSARGRSPSDRERRRGARAEGADRA